MNNGWVSSSAPLILVHAFCFMAQTITKEEMRYLEEDPEPIFLASIIFRLCNDLKTSKVHKSFNRPTSLNHHFLAVHWFFCSFCELGRGKERGCSWFCAVLHEWNGHVWRKRREVHEGVGQWSMEKDVERKFYVAFSFLKVIGEFGHELCSHSPSYLPVWRWVWITWHGDETTNIVGSPSTSPMSTIEKPICSTCSWDVFEKCRQSSKQIYE